MTDTSRKRTAAPRGSLVDHVAERLMGVITTGMRPGDRIESVETLASRYGVSRSVIREAAARLSARGLLEIRQGDGTYVTAPDASTASELFSTLVLRTRQDVRSVFLDVMEFRAALEPEAGRLAAMRATPEDIAAITGAHDRGRRAAAEDDRETLAVADIAFHDALYAASHNAVVEHLMTVMRPLLAEQRTRYPYSQALTDRNDHEGIVHAVLRRDPDAAAAASRAHVEHLRAELTRLMFD